MKFQITVIAGLLLFASCRHTPEAILESKKYTLSDSMLKMITLDTAGVCTMSDELTLSGEIGFNENNVVKIFPRSSGQIIETKVSLGDHVHKGQVLATIKSADVAGSYNDLKSANADLAIAKRQLDNAESLYSGGISSEKELNEARQNYQKALSTRSKIQSIININGGGNSNDGGVYSVVSPIDGYIVEKKAAAGSFIRSDMAEQLFTISDLKSVWVNANVYESDIARVKEGDPVKVIPVAYPDKTFSGNIDKISQVLDPQSKAMRVLIHLDNKDMLLKPEMFARVLVANQSNTTMVCMPTSALLSQENKNYVIVTDGRKNVRLAEVDIFKKVGSKAYVRSGVQAGDILITRHQLFVFTQLVEEQ